MKSLVILGAADGSVSTYQRARELGYHTIAVDIRPSAAGVAYADEFVQVSVRAPEQVAAALLDRDDIAGVLCPASDVGLPAQAWLARHWNLPNPLPERAVQASVDKQVFREICGRLGLPSYGSVGGVPGPELVAAAQQLRFPALVKPVDSSGSRGVVACPGPRRLESAFTEALAFSPAGRVVIEEYVDGDHFSVEALVENGRVAFHAVTERTVTPPPYFVTSAHLLPAGLPASANEQLVAMLNAVCADLGYVNGPMTLDAVLGRDGNLYLIEMGARIGGNGLAEVIDTHLGVDIVAGMIAAAVGEPLRLAGHAPRPTLVHLLTSDRAGHLAAIEGLDQVAAMPEVQRLSLFAEPGDHVRPYEQAGYKLGQVVLCADSVAALREAEAKIRGTLKFLLGEQHVAVPLP
ncbi:ATP-grasp domain-containing protein [Actinokineospora sp. HUAS TT18]|uniref:ATP-grasp domain-containing protein n=1 Tax=Actinokineospora sp. HUAS TT18 TaxID=3447451 RepID=UPI003F51E011